ncbi:MAG: DUF2283 domain-containing protein [Kiritimatiellia bacterium]
MKVKYFPDTDTLLVNFSENKIVDSRDLNEDVLIELDEAGHVASMTIEHAKKTDRRGRILLPDGDSIIIINRPANRITGSDYSRWNHFGSYPLDSRFFRDGGWTRNSAFSA